MATSSADILKSTQPGVISGHLLNGVRVSSAALQHAWQTMADTRGDVVRIDIPADPQARVAFVRRWMAKNQKALKNTGMAATLVLPLMAQQALADSNVAINDLQGVAEVIRMPNGSLTLLMNNGYRIDLAAADVALEGGRVVVDITALMEALSNDSGLLVPLSQLPDVQSWELLPNGDVLITRADGSQMTLARSAVVQQGDLLLISPSSALQYGVAEGTDFGNLLFVPSASFSPAVSGTSMASSSAPVSSFADIPPWLYVGGGAIALGAAAAGGGGGGGGGETGPSTISGYVIDGYISGATVTREFDANSVTTNGSGFFSGLQGSGILTATGGVDISTGLPFTGVLRAPDGSTVITPLTTMMVQLSQQFGLNNSDAESVIKTALGLDNRLNLLTTDPLAEASANVDLLIAGVKVASLLSMAATAGISSADALSLLASAFNQASENGRELTNQEMADALGLPSIAGQVKQALDAIDAAGENLDLDAYRDGSRNPLRDAQREAQDPDSDLSNTIGTRSALDYLTLEQAVSLAQNGELPDQYLINPGQPFNAGMLGLTAAGNQLGLVEMILAGDFDVDTAPIGLGSVYTWSIRADAEDVLVSGGLGRPEVVGAQSVTLTNATIRPDQFADLNTLNNFVLGNTVVPYTLEEALGTADMPANYTLAPGALFNAGNVTVREAAELINNTRQLLDLAQNTGSDGLTRSMLLEWHIVDSLANILATPSARPQINQAESIRVTETIITPAQFVQLDALVNFVLGDTEVDYTLAEALAADPLASNYIINLDKVLDAGTVTVAQAEGTFADVSRILEGANNQPPLTLFVWEISDTAEAIIADLDQGHVIEANQVSASNRVITSAQFDQLNTLENFELGATIVRYTLENAVNAESLAANYDIDTTVPFEAGEVSVNDAAATLEVVERILDGALNTQTPNADALFNWTVVDSAAAILEAVEASNVSHLVRADAVNVSDGLISFAQYKDLVEISNYVRSGETVEYTLSEAIDEEDAGTLLTDYAINLNAILNANEVTVAKAREAYTQIDGLVGNAENSEELRENLPFSWVVVDDADTIILDAAQAHITLANEVGVREPQIDQAQYEALEGLANFELGATVVEYTLEGAVTTPITLASNYLLTNDIYDAGEFRVNTSRNTLERVDNIVAGANNSAELDADTLFNWTVVDSVNNVLNAINEEHLARADQVNVNNQRITIEQFQQLQEGLEPYERSGEWIEYTLEQAFTESEGALVDRYAINKNTLFTPEPLTFEEANVNLSTVRELIADAENTAVLESVYQWSVLDSYANIQAQLGAGLPEGLSLATQVQVTEATLDAEQYETLLNGLDNFNLGDTTNVTYKDISDAVRAEEAGLLAPAERFSFENYTTPYQPTGNLSVEEAADELANVRTVLAGADGFENDDATVQALFDWTVTDSANNIIQAINQGHVTLADRVLITNEEVTFGQYQSLITLANYDYAANPVVVRYTIEEALAVIDDEGIANLDRDGGADSVGYRIGSEVFVAGTFTVIGAETLVTDATTILEGANPIVPSLSQVFSWQVFDRVENVIEALEGDSPDVIKLAAEVRLNNEQISYIDQLFLLEDLDNLNLSGITVEFTYTRFTTATFIANRQVDFDFDNYSLVANDPKLAYRYVESPTENDPDTSLTFDAAQEQYQRASAVIEGATNNVSVTDLVSWDIRDSVNDIDMTQPWAVSAERIYLTESEISGSQLASLLVNNAFPNQLMLDDLRIVFSAEQALEHFDALKAIAESSFSPDLTLEKPDTPHAIGTFSIEEAKQTYQQLETLLELAKASEERPEDYFSWQIDDVASEMLLGETGSRQIVDEAVLNKATNVRLADSQLNREDFEILRNALGERLDASGVVVVYTLEEALDRLPVQLGLHDDYKLNGEVARFDIGVVTAQDAQRIYELVEGILAGANSTTESNTHSVEGLLEWQVRDTLDTFQALSETHGDLALGYLQGATAVQVIGNDSSGNRQLVQEIFEGSGVNVDRQLSDAEVPTPYSLQWTLSGNEPLGMDDPILNFTVGEGGDAFTVTLTADEVKSLRGYPDENDVSAWENFKIYKESNDNFSSLDSDGEIAFAVFTTASFEGDWLNDLTWLDNGEIVFLLAGAGDESDDAWLKRVEGVEGSEADYERLATFENLDLNNFLEENWNTNYSFT